MNFHLIRTKIQNEYNECEIQEISTQSKFNFEKKYRMNFN